MAELTSGSPSAEQQASERYALQHFRWNALVNGLDLVFFTLGLSLVSRETVMPVLVSSLTDSKLAIGLIPALYSLSFYLPQLLVANFSERLLYKKPFVMAIAGPGERGAYLLIGLVVWLLAVDAPQVTLGLFFVLLAISGACSGSATPAWYDMIAKVIPVQRRGIWSGVSHGLGALIAVVGALGVGWILAAAVYPVNFALVFGLAFVALLISFLGLALNREPPSVHLKDAVPLRQYLRQLPAILRRDENFRRFLISRTVAQLGAMATGFFIVYGQERFTIDGVGVGYPTAALVASSAVMNLIWGALADRYGHKLILALAPLLMAAAVLNALLAPSFGWLVLTFVLLGAYQAADTVSIFNIIIEFCPPTERPTYIGLTNTLLAPVLTLAPLLGGWLATVTGYAGLFGVALVAALLGAGLMFGWVREPRSGGSTVNGF